MSDLTIFFIGVGVSGVALASAFVQMIAQDDPELAKASRVPAQDEGLNSAAERQPGTPSIRMISTNRLLPATHATVRVQKRY